MGWWKCDGGIIGDEPLDLLGDCATAIARAYERAHGRMPTKREWAAILLKVLGASDEYRVVEGEPVERVSLE